MSTHQSKSTSSAQDRRTANRNADPAFKAHLDIVYTLVRASAEFDNETGAHLVRIRGIVTAIALALGYDEEDAVRLGYDAMLHDVGKLLVPAPVLKKRGAFTPAERRAMQAHTIAGERLLLSRPNLERAARIARSHHEAWDGAGYPDGLVGEAIPLEARITTAADILDALIAARCYKDGWKFESALEKVLSMGGTAVDPDVAEALRDINASGRLSEAIGVATRCAIVPPPADAA